MCISTSSSLHLRPLSRCIIVASSPLHLRTCPGPLIELALFNEPRSINRLSQLAQWFVIESLSVFPCPYCLLITQHFRTTYEIKPEIYLKNCIQFVVFYVLYCSYVLPSLFVRCPSEYGGPSFLAPCFYTLCVHNSYNFFFSFFYFCSSVSAFLH
jgi:hypothetical protein